MKKLLLIVLLCVLVFLYLRTQHVALPNISTSGVSTQALSLFSAHTPSETVTGPPTITVPFINQVLAMAHSPAQGLGDTLYQQGVKFGVNPAFALAIFHHESGYGRLGVATQTHSLGNIRCTVGWKCDPTGGYRWYPTWTDGVIDFYRVIHDGYLAQKCETITNIIPIYAPSQDHNNVAAYIQAIRADLARWQQKQV